MNPPFLLNMTAPLREDFSIPYHDLGKKEAPPRVALVAGLHGNELNGIWVLARLADFLKGVEEGRYPGKALKKRVIVIPAVNILGLNTRERLWPFDKTDINRMFPGYDQGETTQRIAEAVLRVTHPAFYRLDLHSSNVDFEELPQIRLYGPTESERSTARLFGLPAVIERPVSPIFTSTLAHAWRQNGGENFVIQAGQAGLLQTHHCEHLFGALLRFLSRTGILEGVDFSEEEDVHCFDFRQGFRLFSEQAGFFVSKEEVGRWVQAGQLMGYVYDGFEGRVRTEIRAPVGGLLTGLRRQPLLFEGDLIARIHTKEQP
jgi:uncharacterized protein